jgi:ABC-type glucose/galactose transport system permease subunit
MMVGSLATLVVCISASLAFKNLKTKAGRTHYLSSPSSTLEKFLVNVLIYVVGMTVAYFICAQLADLTRIAALWWFKSDSFIVPGPINFLNSVSETVRAFDELESVNHITNFMSIAMWIGLIANAGLFLLGSVVWPRLSALKTFAALYAVEFALFLIAMPIALGFGDMEAFSRWFYDFVMHGSFSMSMVVWSCLQAIVFFGLAWFLFKRKDVVSLKWWK